MEYRRTHVLGIGGSVICPETTSQGDPEYSDERLRSVVDLLNSVPNDRFFVVAGGGASARHVQDLVKENTYPALKNYFNEHFPETHHSRREELDTFLLKTLQDYAGIRATHDNASHLAYNLKRLDLEGEVCSDIATSLKNIPDFGESRVIVAGGTFPGQTTDGALIEYAGAIGADVVYSVSDFDRVFDVPAQEFDKKKINEYKSQDLELESMTFNHLNRLSGGKHVPGYSYAFDPTAVLRCVKISKAKPSFTLMIGRENQVPRMIRGEDFVGTEVRGLDESS